SRSGTPSPSVFVPGLFRMAGGHGVPPLQLILLNVSDKYGVNIKSRKIEPSFVATKLHTVNFHYEPETQKLVEPGNGNHRRFIGHRPGDGPPRRHTWRARRAECTQRGSTPACSL